MPAYDETITDESGLDEDELDDAQKKQDEPVPTDSFYKGMSEDKMLSVLNGLSQQVRDIQRDSVKQDTRSISDVLFNQNSINPGHQHLLIPSSPTQITANQNNYDIAGNNALRLSTDASRTITGLNGGASGRFLYILNVGSNNIVLANQSASSSAANRMISYTGANLTVATNEIVKLIYDSTTARWRIVGKALALDDLSDVTITSAQTGHVVRYSGSAWVNAYADIRAEYPAAEAIAAGDSVALVPLDVEEQTYADTNQDADLAVGDDAARTYLAQGFVPDVTGYITGVDLYLKKTGSPTDNLVVEVWSSTGVDPNRTPNAILHADLSKATAGSTLTTSYVHYRIHFDELVSVTSATLYYLVIYRSGSIDGSNYYQVGADNSSSAYGGSDETRHVGDATPTWTETTTSDIIFKTYTASTSADAIRKTDADSDLLTQNFIGFAPSAIAEDASGQVIRAGNVTGLSGLSPGRVHYLSSTPGAISVTPASNVAPVLIANSTTTGDIVSLQPPVKVIPRYAGQNTEHAFNANLNNGAEDEIFSTTIPGGTIGANGILKVTYAGKMTVGSLNFIVTLGGTEISNIAPATNADVFICEARAINRNDQAVQVLSEWHSQGAEVGAADFVVDTDDNNTAIDTSADKTLRVYATNGGASGTREYTVEYVLVEIIR